MCFWQVIELILVHDLCHSNALSWVIHLVSLPLIVFVPRYTNPSSHTHKPLRVAFMNQWMADDEEMSRFLKTHTHKHVSQVTGCCVKLLYLPTEADKGCSCSERGWWLSATDALTLIQTETPQKICQSQSTPWFPWNGMMALLNIAFVAEFIWSVAVIILFKYAIKWSVTHSYFQSLHVLTLVVGPT